MPFTNILDGATGDFPHSWISLNSEYLLNNSTEFKKAIGINMAFDQGWGFNVEEETQAIYVKANFDGMFDGIGINYSGNFGVRYIETEQTAVGAITEGNGAYTPYAQDNSYNNTLPSFNINLELADDLYLRLAGAKALARPAISDVAPITNIRFFSNSGSTGNTDLVPEIVTQFDASLEWYFNEGAILSAAIFKKDFKDTIEDGFLNRCFFIPSEYSSSALPNDVDCAADGSEALLGLKSKVNAGDAALKGIEIGYQQSFSQLPTPFDGLGVQANYTFTDSDILQTLTTGFEAPLQDLSRNSYNAVVYYEKHGFTVRMAYNWRDDYYDKLTSSNSAEFAQPYGQLDTSINYKITPKWTIGLNVTNVTNEAEEKYQEIYERFLAYRVNDTRYALTLRGRL
jgi:TonB-dependent receptor